MAGYNTTIIPVSFAPGGTVYINASSTGNTVVINPGTPSNPITAASTAGVLTPAMLLATSYANAISTAADDATTKSSAAYANAVANAAALYQTTAELSANVAKLTSNNSTNFGGYTWATPAALGTTTANSANFTTVNAASHTVGSNFIANTTGISTTGFIAATGSITTNNGITVASATGKIILGTDSGGAISLGRTDGIASAPYIDFNSGATAVDFDARIAVAAGNGTVGFAPLTITSGTLTSISNTLTIGTAAYHVANGNMGIGISTPAQQLAIGNATDQIGLGASGTVATLYFGAPSSGSGGIARLSYSRSTGSLSVIANTVASPITAMTVTPQAQVGVGTTSPVHSLHVVGNTFVTGGNMGIGSSVSSVFSLAVSKDIAGGTAAYGITQSGSVQGDVTSQARGINNTFSVNNNTTFTMGQYYYYGTITSRPAILNTTINSAYGYIIDSTAVAGISSYGFLGNLPASSTSTITNVSLTSNIVTVTTAATHVFWPGQTVVVAATTTTSINGSFTVLTSPSTTTFTYALVLGNIASTADTGTAIVSTGRWNAYMQGTAPNHFLGQMSIGTTNLTNGYLAVSVTQSSAIAMAHIAGTNQWTGATPIGLNNSPTLIGTSAMTNVYGIVNAPVGSLAAGATVGTFGGININPTFNSATTPTSYWGASSQLLFGAAALGGTITNVAGYASLAPSFSASATTNITTYAGFRASIVANGAAQTITNIYAFQGLQATSATSNAYNLYMSGSAKNYLAGNTGIGNTMPDATLAVTGTANISGVVTLGSTLTTASYSKTTATTVGSLVAAATAGAGARSFVTDSTVVASGNFGAIVAGTGANPVPVYSDGTNWRIG